MKECAITGYGYTRHLYNYDKETWLVNTAWKYAKRVDKIFQFHDKPYELEDLQDFQKKGVEIITKNKWENLESTVYPLEEIVARFGRKFFANSVALMIALALYRDYERIELWGIDHRYSEEYVLMKGCVEYWVGVADGMGVEVTIPEASALCRTYKDKVYGFDGNTIDAEPLIISMMGPRG